MADLLSSVTDFCQAGINYIKKLKIAEVRQTLELLGVYHSQVALAVVLFVMLICTRFTAVLLVASLIAYIIFYMLDTLIPEAKGHDHGNFYSHTSNRAANTSFYSSANNVGGRRSPVGSVNPNTNLDYNSPATGRSNADRTHNNADSNTSATRTDARTSAVFPPFGNNDYKGDAVQDKHRHLERTVSNNDVRYYHRYSRPTTINDERVRRDPLPFRRMITHDYRQFRNQAHEVHNSNVNVESNQRNRRSANNEHKAKKERKSSSEKRRASSKNVYDQHYERLKEMSRDHSNKYSQAGAGASNRNSALYGRPVASPPSSHKKKGRLERDLLMKFRLNRWGLPFY